MKIQFIKDYNKLYGNSDCVACSSSIENNHYLFSEVWVDDFSSKMSIYVCANCGLAYSYPFIDAVEEKRLYSDYPSHYHYDNVLSNNISFSHKIQRYIEGKLENIFFSKRNIFLRKLFSSFLFPRMFQTYPIFARKDKEDLKIIDIGCGDGHFLAKAKKNGFRVYGTECNEDAIKRCVNNGICMVSELDDFVASKEKFDVIRINHVLEHLKNPNYILEKAHSLLKDNGELIIGIPNFNTPAKIFREYTSLHLPYHRLHFTRGSISKVLNKNNFDVSFCKTKSIGVFYTNLLRKFPKIKFHSAIKISNIFISIFLDLFNCGDCIEVYAAKKENIK